MTLKKLLISVTAGLAAAFAYAQTPLGTVSNVNGVVTATQGATGMTVAPGTVIQNGMRFVTTTNGSVTLNLNSGCAVTVPAGHGVTVLQSMTCQQLAAAVLPVVPVATGPAFAPSSMLVNGLILAGAAGIVIAGWSALDSDRSVSAK
jgi:hypothetical protein